MDCLTFQIYCCDQLPICDFSLNNKEGILELGKPSVCRTILVQPSNEGMNKCKVIDIDGLNLTIDRLMNKSFLVDNTTPLAPSL
jgi:hypothetical protein